MSDKRGTQPQPEIARGDIRVNWTDFAECKKRPDVTFFPEAEDIRSIRIAKAVCAKCVVIDDCLLHALEFNEPDGIWGGHTFKERKSIRRLWLADKRRRDN